MTIDDIKVGQTYKWLGFDLSFTIIGFDGTYIRWVDQYGNTTQHDYECDRLIKVVNKGGVVLSGTNGIKYNIDKFKFV
jgi:hypothetical protein